ncbi:MAG: hypothetical protein AB7F09_10785 [Parvibaculaceae bacterium]
MDRRERIKLTLEQIKVAKKLVAQQIEFISLAKAIGYEPVHAPATLQRFRAQLSMQRNALVRLTRSGQRVRRAPRVPLSVTRHAA